MKKTLLLVLLIIVLAWRPVLAAGELRKPSKGSIVVSAQAGANSYVTTADRYAEPFHAILFPVGASFEFLASDHWGIGGTLMFAHESRPEPAGLRKDLHSPSRSDATFADSGPRHPILLDRTKTRFSTPGQMVFTEDPAAIPG